MAGADLAAPDSGKKKKGRKRKGAKRISVRIDMTPMVDVIMLLLTFFMLTTVFKLPQTMEINIPPDMKTQVEVPMSSLMTLRYTADSTLYYNMAVEDPQKVDFKDLRTLLIEKRNAIPRLIVLVKVEREGTFNQMVDVMDEINMAEITRFSLAPFTDRDKAIIRKVFGA
ncbi:MAG TPA: biopolymer transporter ExbD [bacterium]